MISRDFGFMQGRLSPIFRNKIQSFPHNNWKNEFYWAKKLGFNHIEWTVDQYFINFNPISYSSGLEEIKNIKKITSIKINSLTADFIMDEPFFKSEFSIKYLIEKQLENIILNASKVGIKCFVVPLVDNAKIETNNQKKNIISFFRNLSSFIRKNKIKIAFEIDLRPKKVINFLDSIKDDNFGINFDTGNSASLDYDPEEEIKLYNNRIFNIHLKDRILNGNTVRFGSGNTNFNLIFEQLNRINYKKSFTIQMARSKSNKHIQEIKFAKNYIDKLIKSYDC